MNGDVLANRVRLILRDTQSPADQGLFWSDMEIALALNNAQAIFVNASLRLGLSYLLAGLNVTTGFVTPPDTGWIPLPDNYLHYVSAMVGTDQFQVVARVYQGATAEVFRNSNVAGVFIVGNQYRGILGNDTNTGVILNYFRKPSYIGLTSLGDNINRPDFNVQDFDMYIYTDIIATHAAVLLGFKEIQTQRDFKFMKHIFSYYSIFPKRLVSLLKDLDIAKAIMDSLLKQQES